MSRADDLLRRWISVWSALTDEWEMLANDTRAYLAAAEQPAGGPDDTELDALLLIYANDLAEHGAGDEDRCRECLAILRAVWKKARAAPAAQVPEQMHDCPNCGSRSVFLPKTPRDIVERLGRQQGSRVAASLRGDKTTQEAAEKWLTILASDHWHEIISDLTAMYAAAQEPQG